MGEQERQLELFADGPELDPRTGLIKSVAERKRQAAAKRDDAIHRVQLHNADWYERALAVVRKIARYKLLFTSEDVWDQMELLDDLPREKRAMGAVMKKAVKLKICMATGEWEKGRRASRHCGPVAVWCSKICEVDQLTGELVERGQESGKRKDA